MLAMEYGRFLALEKISKGVEKSPFSGLQLDIISSADSWGTENVTPSYFSTMECK